MNKAIIILLLSVIVISVNAQINTSNFDSIPLSIKNSWDIFQQYEFNHAVLPQVRISLPKARMVDKGSYNTRNAAKDFGADIAANILGGSLNLSTGREMNWLIRGKIVCPNKLLNWDIEIYGYGELVKIKERVQDIEGNKSVTTHKYARIYWDEGASGFLMENEKTIGQFLVFTRPRDDSLFYNANRDVFDLPKTLLVSAYNKHYNDDLNQNIPEYAVVGKFREEEFVLIANGETRNMWFFINNKLVCVFQPDLDELGFRKKDRIEPYILIDEKVTEDELVDWYRLALVSKYFSTTIGAEMIAK